jgi:hypothetical protein
MQNSIEDHDLLSLIEDLLMSEKTRTTRTTKQSLEPVELRSRLKSNFFRKLICIR